MNSYIKQFPDLMSGKKIMYVHGFLSSAQSRLYLIQTRQSFYLRMPFLPISSMPRGGNTLIFLSFFFSFLRCFSLLFICHLAISELPCLPLLIPFPSNRFAQPQKDLSWNIDCSDRLAINKFRITIGGQSRG